MRRVSEREREIEREGEKEGGRGRGGREGGGETIPAGAGHSRYSSGELIQSCGGSGSHLVP